MIGPYFIDLSCILFGNYFRGNISIFKIWVVLLNSYKSRPNGFNDGLEMQANLVLNQNC